MHKLHCVPYSCILRQLICPCQLDLVCFAVFDRKYLFCTNQNNSYLTQLPTHLFSSLIRLSCGCCHPECTFFIIYALHLMNIKTQHWILLHFHPPSLPSPALFQFQKIVFFFANNWFSHISSGLISEFSLSLKNTTFQLTSNVFV